MSDTQRAVDQPAAREARRAGYRAELERLRGRIARSHDAATIAKLNARIRTIEGRLARG